MSVLTEGIQAYACVPHVFTSVCLCLQKSAGTSDVGSVGENLLSLVSTVPDEQSQVFMVLDEDVSKSVVRGHHSYIHT